MINKWIKIIKKQITIVQKKIEKNASLVSLPAGPYVNKYKTDKHVNLKIKKIMEKNNRKKDITVKNKKQKLRSYLS